MAANAPRPPEVKFLEPLNATYNDPKLTERLRAALTKSMGAEAVTDGEQVMGAEDFGEFAQAGVPAMLLWVGAAEPKKFEQAKAAKTDAMAPTHSAYFAPDKDRSLRTGIKAWVGMAKELLPRK
jgi:hippurate hydrolase